MILYNDFGHLLTNTFMIRILTTIIFISLSHLMASAIEWDKVVYSNIENSIQLPEINNDLAISIVSCGAKANASAAHNQHAIQQAIDRCSKRGGGRVVVPANMHFLTGAIQLKSKVNLVVEEGAVLEFAFQPSLYPIVETSWEGIDCYNLSPCIYAFHAHDIAITGKGTIDGGGSRDTWWAWCGKDYYGWKEGIASQNQGARQRLLDSGEAGIPMTLPNGRRTDLRTFTAKDGMRPQLVGLNSCKRILIEDVTLLRSPFWVIHPLKSEDVTIKGVRINNDGPNGDGCDPESCNRVLIENCYFNTGDDCIAIKSGRNADGRRRAMPSQNIIIRHCQMRNGHGGVVIGSEISGGCWNIFAHDCHMDSPNLDRVLRIKTNTCRGGKIRNIFMKDVTVGQCREAVLRINLNYESREACRRGFNPSVSNVLMENVTCKKSKYGVQIIGLDDGYFVNDVTLRNCHFTRVEKGNSITGKVHNIDTTGVFINNNMPYSLRMALSEMKRTPQSCLLDFSSKPKWSYVMGIELEAILDTYLRYGGDDIRRYCQDYVDTMITADGKIRGYKYDDFNLDNVRTGHFIARMHQLAPSTRTQAAISTLLDQLDCQPRTVTDSIYWHKAIYSHQVWLDGIFMGLPFRTLAASMADMDGMEHGSKANRIYDDAINQITATYNRTIDPATNLNRHAWDETREMFWADPHTGLSKHCWGRAQGWFAMALVELLDALPSNNPRRPELIALLNRCLDGIIQWQDKETGLWYQVMDSPGKEGNYLESTCSCMFAYSLLKSYRLGYTGKSSRDAGTRAYHGIIDHFIRNNPDSTISLTQCCSVAGLGPGISDKVLKAAPGVKENRRRDGTFGYYISEPVRDNDPKGIGPFIWASLEMEREGHGKATEQ